VEIGGNIEYASLAQEGMDARDYKSEALTVDRP